MSLFLVWGRLATVEIGAMIAIISGVGFFVLNITKAITEAPEEKKKLSLSQKMTKGFIFLLPFLILSVYFVPKYLVWKGAFLELYKYHDYPCENKIFKTQEKMVLMTHHDGMLPRSAYYITHNSLENYKEEYVKSYYTHRQATYIEKGKAFKVIGYYRPISPGSGDSPYYLAESLDNKKTKVWIDVFSFNSKQCYPEDFPYYEKKHFSAQRGTYGEEKIDLSKLTILP